MLLHGKIGPQRISMLYKSVILMSGRTALKEFKLEKYSYAKKLTLMISDMLELNLNQNSKHQ